MSTAYGFLCPTPKDKCCGTLGKFSASLEKLNIRKHGSRQEAFNCYTKWLLSTGHTQLSRREYLRPEGGILLLSKVPHFGAELRAGKGDEKGTTKPSRGMPSVRHGGCIVSP